MTGVEGRGQFPVRTCQSRSTFCKAVRLVYPFSRRPHPMHRKHSFCTATGIGIGSASVAASYCAPVINPIYIQELATGVGGSVGPITTERIKLDV